MSELLLSPAEARVLASLVEKSVTTPQYYPMTVNAIMLAANQKTSRHPVMSLSEGDVGNALNRLEELRLIVRDTFSGRVQKWRHQFSPQLMLKPQTAGLLATLMLRGPQTLAELRANGGPLGGPTEGEALSAALNDLADRARPLVVQLPRAPGQAAQRYAHTLCGDVQAAAEWSEPDLLPSSRPEPGVVASLEARVAALEARLAELESKLRDLL